MCCETKLLPALCSNLIGYHFSTKPSDCLKDVRHTMSSIITFSTLINVLLASFPCCQIRITLRTNILTSINRLTLQGVRRMNPSISFLCKILRKCFQSCCFYLLVSVIGLLLHMITLNNTYTLGRTALDEGSARCRGFQVHNTEFTRDIHPCSRKNSNPQSQ